MVRAVGGGDGDPTWRCQSGRDISPYLHSVAGRQPICPWPDLWTYYVPESPGCLWAEELGGLWPQVPGGGKRGGGRPLAGNL